MHLTDHTPNDMLFAKIKDWEDVPKTTQEHLYKSLAFR